MNTSVPLFGNGEGMSGESVHISDSADWRKYRAVAAS